MAGVRIRVGHSADPDDAFMFWALEAGRVDTRGLELEQVVSDIQTLNEWATRGPARGDARSRWAPTRTSPTATCCCRTAPRWARATGRSSSRASRSTSTRCARLEIVIPGRLTTAYLVLRLALGEDVRVRELPFDRILDEVASGRADAGLVIHEGQLTYAEAGLAQGARPRRVVAGARPGCRCRSA